MKEKVETFLDLKLHYVACYPIASRQSNCVTALILQEFPSGQNQKNTFVQRRNYCKTLLLEPLFLSNPNMGLFSRHLSPRLCVGRPQTEVPVVPKTPTKNVAGSRTREVSNSKTGHGFVKGIVPQKFYRLSFWSEGPKNHPKTLTSSQVMALLTELFLIDRF